MHHLFGTFELVREIVFCLVSGGSSRYDADDFGLLTRIGSVSRAFRAVSLAHPYWRTISSDRMCASEMTDDKQLEGVSVFYSFVPGRLERVEEIEMSSLRCVEQWNVWMQLLLALPNPWFLKRLVISTSSVSGCAESAHFAARCVSLESLEIRCDTGNADLGFLRSFLEGLGHGLTSLRIHNVFQAQYLLSHTNIACTNCVESLEISGRCKISLAVLNKAFPMLKRLRMNQSRLVANAQMDFPRLESLSVDFDSCDSGQWFADAMEGVVLAQLEELSLIDDGYTTREMIWVVIAMLKWKQIPNIRNLRFALADGVDVSFQEQLETLSGLLVSSAGMLRSLCILRSFYMRQPYLAFVRCLRRLGHLERLEIRLVECSDIFSMAETEGIRAMDAFWHAEGRTMSEQCGVQIGVAVGR